MAFTRRGIWTVQTSQVTGTLTDFPTLISITNNDFKQAGSGGYVANAGGYDTRWFSDYALTSPLYFELRKYDSSTGTYIFWVKWPSISTGAIIYSGTGDAALNTDGSSSTTWSDYGGMWHLDDGTTLSLANSSTATGSTALTGFGTPTAVAGKINGGAGLASASSQYFTASNGYLGTSWSAMTFRCWLNITSFPYSYSMLVDKNPNGGNFIQNFVNNSGKWSGYTPAGILNGTTTLSTGTWYLLHHTVTAGGAGSGTQKLYVNGAQDATGASTFGTTTALFYLGDDHVNTPKFINGAMDEVRMFNGVKTADWISAEYKNESAPTSFLSYSGENVVSATPRTQIVICG